MTSTLEKNGEVAAIRCNYFNRWMPTIGPRKVYFEPNSHICKHAENIKAQKRAEYTLAINQPGLTDREILELKEEFIHVPITDIGFKTKEEIERYLGI